MTTRTVKALDLFCGAGGASCGMWQAGAELVASVDQDEDALETHAENLPGEHIQHDLSDVDPSILPTTDVDWTHGSPPCQGFSQAKGDRDPEDESNQLIYRFIEWVEEIQPPVVTMENVTGMRTISDHYLKRVMGAFRDAGYETKWRKLNAADYGVPQTRKRIFVVGVREDLETPSQWFPEPTHAETRTTTLSGRRLDEWRTVRDAIGDLADVRPGDTMTSQQNEGHQFAGRRPFHSVDEPARTIRCGTPPKLMADGGSEVPNHDPEPLSDQAMDYLTRDERHFKKHPPNTMDEPSRTIPANIHKGVPYGLVEVPNHNPVDHAPEARAKMAKIGLGETTGSVTESRLAPDEPSRTIACSSSTPPIHYKGPLPEEVTNEPACTVMAERPYLNERGHADHINERSVRRLTVREAARLQSFDDWFVFKGTKTAQLRQVGNAVPPRLQQHMAAHVRELLGDNT